MKRSLFSLALCLAAILVSAQSYEVRTLTFEDADYRGSGNVVGGNDWSSLIDDAEYNGTLLYGDGKDTYMWYDEGNTDLVWDGLQGVEYWSGGAAISNYYEPDLTSGTFERQLSIPLEKSNNQFVVVFSSENLKGYPSYSHCSPFYFADGKARVIESVDVINTTYALNSLTNGDGFAPAATDESQFVLHFVGTHEDGTTAEVTFLLADGRNFVSEWTKVDLTPLGKVKSLRTYVTGSSDLEGDYGLNTPGYVALDNIKVRFELPQTVTVTMNAKSKLIKSLVNMATNETVEVGEPTSNKYTFDAFDGSYLLTATASDGTTVSGTIQLDIDADHTAFTIYSPEVWVKNTDWVYGTDYSLDLKVTDKESNVVNTTMGEYTNGHKMFLVFNGNTYYLDVVPSANRQAEGYLPASYTGTVSFNPTVNAEAPMGYAYSVTVPAGATFSIGTKTAHFVKFKEVVPESVTNEGTVYNYILADKQVYNYRVMKEGKLTQAGIFTMSGDETKRPTLAFTDADMEARSPKAIDHDVTSNGGYNVSDLFLNINAAGHLKLNGVGDTYDILPMRNWELTNNLTANYFIEPDFHFTVVNLNGEADNSVVKVENEMLTAVGEGTAIVLVTYDGIHLDYYNGSATSSNFAGGNDWGAIWPENTGAFVVTVGEQATGITPNIIINKDYLTTVTPWGGGDPIDTKLSMENVDAEFDVLYYLDTEEGFDYTFTPEGVASVTLARPVIGEEMASYTGFSSEGVTANADGSYTLRLTEGRNIVCLTGADGKSVYQVMTAKPCHRDITVGGEAVTKVKPGDAVKVQYTGLYHPAGKLAGIHNFNAFLDYKKPAEGVSVTKGKGNQYTMAASATAQAVSFTVPADWTAKTIEINDGVMCIGGFGDPVGNHRATSKDTGRAPNFTAIQQNAVFGRVPAIVLPVDVPALVATFEDVADITEPVDGHMSVGTEDDDDREFFTSGDYAFNSGCMHDYDYWYWFGYASRTETKYEELDDQWNNIVGGGYNGSATYGVAYAAAFNGPCYVELLGSEPATVPGFYITNSSYAYTSMCNGDASAKKFEKGDWFKLTITGYDGDNVTATKDYYLADLRDEKTAFIINDWRYVDLSCLGKVTKIGFELTSTDNGSWGMNTPAYFCFDDFGAEGTEVLPESNVVFVSSVGYSTCVAKNNWDFSEADVEAFAVTESTEEGHVHLTPITEAPAGEAIVVKAAEGAYVVPTASATPAAVAGNLLKPALADITADGTQYILADGSEGVAFYQATTGSTIAAGKGYLEFTGSGVKAFTFDDDNATGINNLDANANLNEPIYNIAGQRMSKMQRGINIIGNKKILK